MSEHSSRALDRVNNNPLYRSLGIRLVSHNDGDAVSQLRPTDAHCWPFEGQPHGGILFTLMDTTLAMAMLPDFRGRYTSATISMDIQYTQRANRPPFTCTAHATRRGSKTGFGQGDIRDAAGELIAMAQGTFRLIDRER